MRRAKVIAKVAVLVFCFFTITGFNHIHTDGMDSDRLNAYMIYVNDTGVGIVKSAAKGLKLYDEIMNDIQDQYTDPDINIKADIYFKEVQADYGELANEEELKKALKEAVMIYKNAYAIVIDGNEVCYLKTQQEAAQVLDGIKFPYKQAVESMEDTVLEEIEFKEEVDIHPKTVLFSDIVNIETASKIITMGSEEIKEYEVKEGDTLWGISRKNDMRVEDILAANPDMDSDTIRPGQKIRLQATKSLLTTVTREMKVYTEAIPYETVEEESQDLYKGEKKIKHKGENGEKEIQLLIVRENGTEVSREKISESIIKEPVKQVELIGTKNRPVKTSDRKTTRPADTTPISKNGVEMTPWFGGANKIFTRGSTAKVTHVGTGLTFYVKRRGGTNHADCEPLTAADTAVIKKIYGGSFSWARKPIIVQVNGKKMAASMNGMPHGGASIRGSNFPGQFCIHFYGSRTHGTNRVDADHQAMVRQAAGLLMIMYKN